MKKLLSLFSVVVLLMLAGSCKKDDETSLNKTDLLCKAPWKLTAATIDPAFPMPDFSGNTVSITDFYAQMVDDCSKDDTQKYNSDGTFTFDEGSVKCDSETPQTSTGTWTFNPDETIITETDPDGSYSYHMIKITENEMQISEVMPMDGVNYTITMTMKH
ncbi:MAG TPA: lipocalin family protein [Bacteroidales bacterium]|nr:lipocalin family protein [Bacteroidales bacterium]